MRGYGHRHLHGHGSEMEMKPSRRRDWQWRIGHSRLDHANTAGDNVLRGLTDSAQVTGAGTMNTSAEALINGSFLGFQSGTFSAYSYTDGMPSVGIVNELDATASNVSAALGSGTTAVDFADGTQGALRQN